MYNYSWSIFFLIVNFEWFASSCFAVKLSFECFISLYVADATCLCHEGIRLLLDVQVTGGIYMLYNFLVIQSRLLERQCYSGFMNWLLSALLIPYDPGNLGLCSKFMYRNKAKIYQLIWSICLVGSTLRNIVCTWTR